MNSSTVVWITGAGTGLGRALAQDYATQGASVALSGRRVAPLEAVAKDIRSAGGEALVVPLDVTDHAAVTETVHAVVDWKGRLDTVVANAGYGCAGTFSALSIEDFRRQFDVNFFGLIATAKASLPYLQKTKGRLALIGSVAAFYGLPNSGAYSASKAALRALGQSMAVELEGTGVSVTVVHPGFVESDIYKVRNDQTIDDTRKDARPQKLMWKAPRAARVMARAIEGRKRDFVFTGHGRLGAFLMQHFPGFTHFVLTRPASRKSADAFDKT
ncbi:MAG: SDR family NAD(P)-dependent oxidoreductase [Myxococcota bacterium]